MPAPERILPGFLHAVLASAALIAFLWLETAASQDAAKDLSENESSADFVFASGCTDSSFDSFPIANARTRGYTFSDGTLFAVLEVINNSGRDLTFCQHGQLLRAQGASDSENTGKEPQTRSVEVTILDDGLSHRIVLRPSGAIIALGVVQPEKPAVSNPLKGMFIPLTSAAEDVTIKVIRKYEDRDGRVYGPGDYRWKNGELSPTTQWWQFWK